MRSATASPRRPRLPLWRQPDFVKLWSAETISHFGTQVSLLAIPLVAAVTLEVGAFEFGLLTTIEFLPFVLISLPAGVWIDRLRRRPILIVADVGRAVALVTIPVAYLAGALTIWQLYVVGFATGCLTVLFDVSYQSYLPSLVERDEILDGNAKLETSRSAAQIAGPGIAGVLIGLLGAPLAIVLDSVSYLVSGAFVWRIRKHEPEPEYRRQRASGVQGPGMRREIGEGLRYVVTHPYLRAIAATTASSNFFSNVAFAITVLYVVRAFGLTAKQIGVAFSIGATGFLIGALLANRIGTRLGVGPTIIGAAIIFGPSALPVALATRDIAVPMLALAGFVGGFGGAVYNINQVSLRQAITPTRLQGRMNATMRFIVWGTIPAGATLGGALGSVIGLHETIWIGAIGGVFVFLPVLLSPVRHVTQMPEPVEPTLAIDRVADALDETTRPGGLGPAPSSNVEPERS
ncbi:MAG: MFS transporter [Chloroflexota bacterium]|nr:MFS transporter [Chloroflexota bacterium]